MNNFKKIIIAVGLFVMAGSAVALPIDGIIRFSGGVTSFDIVTNNVDITGDQAIVSIPAPTGTFASEGVTFGTIATYNDFNYSQPIVGGSINPLWSVGGFSFELTTIDSVDELNPGFLDLEGRGIMTFAGANIYEATDYLWSFSVDSVRGGIFTFSSTNVAAPAPAMILLMGLIVLSVSGRGRKSV